MTTRIGLRTSRLLVSTRRVVSPVGCCSSSSSSSSLFSSNAETESSQPPTTQPLPFTSKSLGLWKPLVQEHVNQIQILDEISSSWKEPNHKIAIDKLERAADIFADHKTGCAEHCAVLALLAQRRILLGKKGGKDGSVKTIRTLLELQSVQLDNPHVLFALTKAMVETGDIPSALEVVTELLNLEQVQQDPILWACAVNAKVALWTMQMKFSRREGEDSEDSETTTTEEATGDADGTDGKSGESPDRTGGAKPVQNGDGGEKPVQDDDDGEEENNQSPVEKFYMLHAGLRREAIAVHNEHPRLCAILYNTLGIMESESIKPQGFGWGNESSFVTALQLAKRGRSTFDFRLQATIQANHAWSILDTGNRTRSKKMENERLKEASKLGSEALSLVEKAIPEVDTAEHEFALGRTLSLLGTLYAKVDNAVSSEGLFQTSIDLLDNGSGSINAIASINAYDQYAKLLRSWDRREGDAERIEEQRDAIKISDDSFWSQQYPIVAGLVLPTPCDIDTYQVAIQPRYDYFTMPPLPDDE